MNIMRKLISAVESLCENPLSLTGYAYNKEIWEGVRVIPLPTNNNVTYDIFFNGIADTIDARNYAYDNDLLNIIEQHCIPFIKEKELEKVAGRYDIPVIDYIAQYYNSH